MYFWNKSGKKENLKFVSGTIVPDKVIASLKSSNKFDIFLEEGIIIEKKDLLDKKEIAIKDSISIQDRTHIEFIEKTYTSLKDVRNSNSLSKKDILNIVADIVLDAKKILGIEESIEDKIYETEEDKDINDTNKSF